MKQNYKDKKVTVMGLGLYKNGTGIEAVKFFLRRGAKVTVTDLRSREQLKVAVKSIGNKNVLFVLGKHRKQDFENADIVFQNPSVRADSQYLKIARENNIPIVNDWSIFLSEYNPRIFVGVTGTRGKSTTTALIYNMMKMKYKKVWLAGNIGLSPLSFIDKYKGEPIVAEFSSWLLHHVKTSPKIAIVTNIMNDHLNKYNNIKEYILDKENIFKYQTKKDVLILNKENPYTKSMAKKAKGKVVWFSHKAQVKTLLLGKHNVGNVNAAVVAAKQLKINKKDIDEVLRKFKGLPNRLELIKNIKGVKYYNDTTSTTPDATIAALNSLNSKNIILIAGGADKELEYDEFAIEVGRYCKEVILLSGDATKKMGIIGKNAKDMQSAVKLAHSLAQKGDIILLSPGAASFGLFSNEFDRGDKFVDAIKGL